MAQAQEERDTDQHWLLWLFGAVLALFGLAMAGGGSWLITLGGSWYYLLAGVVLLMAGIGLMKGRMAGAWWFAAAALFALVFIVFLALAFLPHGVTAAD